MKNKYNVRSRTFLLGLDGATWDIINPLMEKGLLPNFLKATHEGAYGKLRSIDPYFSPMVWTSIATGKLPDKHGIRHFFNVSSDLKTKRIWNIIEEQGGTVGVSGWLVTWPPEKVNGFIMPDWLARDSSTHPASLKFLKDLETIEKTGKKTNLKAYLGIIRACINNGVRWETLLEAGRLALLKNSGTSLKLRKKFLRQKLHRDVFMHQLKRFKPHFSALVVPDIDSLSHNYWKYLEPEKFDNVDEKGIEQFGRVIHDAYIEADKTLGRLIEMIDDGGTLVVMSDHGFMAEQSHTSTFESVNTDVLLKGLKMPEIESVANFCNRVYVYPKDITDIEKIINTLKIISIRENGNRIFDIERMDNQDIAVLRVHKMTEDVSSCHVEIGGVQFAYKDIINESKPVEITGNHAPDGIFMMLGPDIKKGFNVHGATVLDIVPTILPLMGLPIGRDMDGKFISDIFLREPEVKYIDSYDDDFKKEESEKEITSQEEEELKEKLRNLGYLS